MCSACAIRVGDSGSWQVYLVQEGLNAGTLVDVYEDNTVVNGNSQVRPDVHFDRIGESVVRTAIRKDIFHGHVILSLTNVPT